MAFEDLLEPDRRVKPVSGVPKIVGKNCRKCGEYYQQDMFIPSRSFFFPDGYIDICNNCLDKWLDDCTDISKADKFCQYADIPFNINDWMTMVHNNGRGMFKMYANQNWSQRYDTIDWKPVHDEWKQIMKEEDYRDKIGALSIEDLNKLREFWGSEYTEDQLKRFQALYDDIEKTQSITTAIQRDNARKMCMLSYQVEKAIWNEDLKGSDIKALVSSYNDLAKASDFSPKTARNAGDFESIGELCAFLEKRGYMNKFYDWKPKDEIDQVMKNLQSYTKRIVVGETNIAEELNTKLDQIQQMNRMEDYSDEDEEYSRIVVDDNLADEFNEAFEVDD